MTEDFYKIRVKDIYTPFERTPFLIEESDYKSLLNLLSVHAHAWIVDNKDDMHITGIITEKDMLGFLTENSNKKIRLFGFPKIDTLNKNSKASDLMVRKPIICTVNECVGDVIRKLSTYRVRRLPVVDDNKRFIGEITIQVLIKKLNDNFKK